MMFIYGRIVIPFHSLSSKSRNSKVLTYLDLKMALNFAIIGSIACYQKNKNFIFEWENIDQLALGLEHFSKIAVGEFIFITRFIIVRIWSESLPRYGSTIINSFLSAVLTTNFRVNTLSKNYFIHLSTKSRG